MHPRQLEILTALKRRLKEEGISYSSLAQGLGVSKLTIKRCLTIQGLSVDRLLEICEFMGISLSDLIATEIKDPESENYHMTLDEDKYFADHILEYLFFFNLALTLSLSKTAKAFDLTEARAFGLARNLEKRGFLKIMPKNKLHFPKGTMLHRHPKGPLTKKIGNTSSRAFWEAGNFEGELSHSINFQASFSDSSVIEIKADFQRFWERVVQLSFRDMRLPHDQLKDFGIMFGLRPYAYDPAAHYRNLTKS